MRFFKKESSGFSARRVGKPGNNSPKNRMERKEDMTAEQDIRYGQNAVSGSLAYDFDNPDLYREIEYGLPLPFDAPPAEAEQAQPQEQEWEDALPRAERRVRAKQSVAPAAVLGVLAAAAMFVVAIMAQIQLTGLSAESVALEAELAELQTENARLQIAYESAFNLTEIEEYATGVLGMQKPGADQITYIDTSSPDRAVVISNSTGDGFVDRLSDFLAELGSYFR